MASYNFYQPTSSSVWNIKHELNSTHIAIDVMILTGGNVYEKVQAADVSIVDKNNVTVTFNSPTPGRARIVSATNIA